MRWALVGNSPGSYEMGTAQAETFEGHPVNYLRSIADPGAGFASLQHEESPVRFVGKRLSLRGAIRAEGVTGWTSLWIRLDGKVSGQPLAYKRMETPITGSREWERYALTTDVGPDATNVACGVILQGTGSLQLSDFSLAVEGEEIVDTEEAEVGVGTVSTSTLASAPEGITSIKRPQTISGFELLAPEDCPTFAAIGGMQSVKDQLAATVGRVLTDPVRAAQLKISFNGVLLYGPLGTGKSLFGRALAGEYRCNLVLALAGQLRSAPNELIAERLDEAFQLARSRAPAVLFFDEFDWLWTQPDRKPLLDALLDRLQRTLAAATGDARVVPVAATQALDDVNPSSIPSGLFDLKIRVGLPDAAARSAILDVQLRGRPVSADVDTAALAAATEGLSAASLGSVVEVGALKALARKQAQTAITQSDLLAAIRERGGRDRPSLEQWTWEALILPSATKQELQELQRMIEDPSRAQRFGIVPPRGALLYGPPGTGKTTIARVLAAQAKTSFYPIKGSDIVSKWLGESEQRVHDLFVRARENKPSIVFLDEIDALGAARGGSDSGAMDRILNQLLQEIDGLQSGPGVFVLGATNRRDMLDDALLRGGRLGRQIEIPLPDVAGRVAMLKNFTKSMPLDPAIDIDALAARTARMSGADLQQLCQQAAVHAMMVSAEDAGRVSAEDFEVALALTTRRPAIA